MPSYEVHSPKGARALLGKVFVMREKPRVARVSNPRPWVHRGITLLVCQDHLVIRMLFLPTYSPELNPCELVFSQVKRYIRAHRNSDEPLLVDLVMALASVSTQNVLGYYDHCINNPGF